MKGFETHGQEVTDEVHIFPSAFAPRLFCLRGSDCRALIATSPYPDDLSRWAFNHGAVRVIRAYDLNLEPKP